nr:hypothetical protein [Tanacetum cinerariifolium]
MSEKIKLIASNGRIPDLQNAVVGFCEPCVLGKQKKCLNPVASKDKEVHMLFKDYDDAFVCCIENTINDRIMDSSASFYATYCKEELERFMLCSGKVRLADDKTLDIVDVVDVVLKTSFGTS